MYSFMNWLPASYTEHQGRATTLAIALLCFGLCCGLTACSKNEKQEDLEQSESQPVVLTDPEIGAHSNALWNTGNTKLALSVEAVKQFNQQVQRFIQQPDQQNFDTAKQRWSEAHSAYLQFEVFTFLGVASPDLFHALSRHNFAIHAWPMTPGYIDYFDVYTGSGMVNDIALTISATEVRRQHGLTDDADVSLGFHSLEYLLWGESGLRTVDDYRLQDTVNEEQAAAGLRVIDLPNNRRRTLLGLTSQLLTDDLNQLQANWGGTETSPSQTHNQLPAASTIPLWKSTALQYLTTLQQRYPRIRLSPAAESVPTDNSDSQSDTAASIKQIPAPDFHSQYSQLAAPAIVSSLTGLQAVLFDEESGLGQWMMSPEIMATQNSAFDTLLASMENQPDTITIETVQAMLSALLDGLNQELVDTVQ